MLDIRATELDPWPPKYTHALEALDDSLRAIRLLEAGATSTSVKADQVNSVTAYLYQTAAMVEAKNAHRDQALKYYRKSSATDPENSNLKTRNYFGVGLVYKAKYEDALHKYYALPEAKRTSVPPDAEVTAVFNELYDKVKDGSETKRTLEFSGRKDYRDAFEKDLDEIRAQEIWRAGKTVRSLRPEAK